MAKIMASRSYTNRITVKLLVSELLRLYQHITYYIAYITYPVDVSVKRQSLSGRATVHHAGRARLNDLAEKLPLWFPPPLAN